MSPLHFIAAVLATYVLSLMVSRLNGPGGLFAKLRRLPPPKSSAREGISCPICSGTWLAAIVIGYCAAWLGIVSAAEWPLWWLAVTGGSAVLHLIDGK